MEERRGAAQREAAGLQLQLRGAQFSARGVQELAWAVQRLTVERGRRLRRQRAPGASALACTGSAQEVHSEPSTTRDASLHVRALPPAHLEALTSRKRSAARAPVGAHAGLTAPTPPPAAATHVLSQLHSCADRRPAQGSSSKLLSRGLVASG